MLVHLHSFTIKKLRIVIIDKACQSGTLGIGGQGCVERAEA
jgi:hypothetical protein